MACQKRQKFNSGALIAEGNLIKGLTLKEVIEKNSGKKKSLISKAKSTAAKAAKKAVTAKRSSKK